MNNYKAKLDKLKAKHTLALKVHSTLELEYRRLDKKLESIAMRLDKARKKAIVFEDKIDELVYDNWADGFKARMRAEEK